MNRRVALIGLMLTVLVVWPAAAGADTTKLLETVWEKTHNAIAAVRFTVDTGGGRGPTITGEATCIKNAKGIGTFMTLSISSTLKPEQIKDLELAVPGQPGKTIPAKLLGVHPSTNIGFIQATKPHNFTAVQFRKQSAPVLTVGTPVVSVGLMPRETGFEPCLGVGYVSAVVSVPETLVRVTGGRLTNIGSPVFTADGLAVGMVERQLPLPVLVQEGRRQIQKALRAQQDTMYFTASEELVDVLMDPPTIGQRLPWAGVLTFDSVAEDVHKTQPAVKVGKVIPGSPAHKAGLIELSLVVALDGKKLPPFPTPGLVQAYFFRKLMRRKPGETITVSVLRGGKTEQLSLKLEEMPMRPEEAAKYVHRGLAVQVRDKVDLDKYIGLEPVPDDPGVLVDAAPADGRAGAAGLRGGDLITAVNSERVKSVATFRETVERLLAKQPPEAISLLVLRSGKEVAITIRAE